MQNDAYQRPLLEGGKQRWLWFFLLIGSWSTLLIDPTSLGSRPILAQDASQAQRLAREGSAAFDAERFDEAIVKYEAALHLLKHPVLYVNLSKALRAAHRIRDAAEACQAALSTQIVADPETKRAAQRCIRELRDELQQVSVRILSLPTAAELQIDGRSVGKTPWEGRVSPGRRQFDLNLDGYHPATRVVQGEPSEHLNLRVQLSPLGLGAVLSLVSDPPGARVTIDGEYIGEAPLRGFQLPKGERIIELNLPGYAALRRRIILHDGESRSLALYLGSESGERPTPWPVWGLIGTGSALSLLGGYFGYEALYARDQARSLALTSRVESDRGRYDGYRQSMESYRNTSDILWISGGVLLLSGATWWVIDSLSEPTPPSPAAPLSAPASTPAPVSDDAPPGFFD
ncbi:MAG: PEGA domain-containing protein [Myxococcota bacterium]|nr:PEGA domain-containing protein [Myxococcota bacterium]